MSQNNQQPLTTVTLSLFLALAAAVLSVIFLAWLSEEVLEGETRPFDDATRSAVHTLAGAHLTSVMKVISFLGSTLFLFAATVVVVVLFAIWHWKREAILFPLTMIGAALLNTTLKVSFHRARPVPYFDLPAPSSYSFPSGHALASFCFYGALAALLTARIKTRGMAAAVWLLAALFVLLIGLSRIYLGVHYTTDVIAGYLAALIWVLAVHFAERYLAQRRRARE